MLYLTFITDEYCVEILESVRNSYLSCSQFPIFTAWQDLNVCCQQMNSRVHDQHTKPQYHCHVIYCIVSAKCIKTKHRFSVACWKTILHLSYLGCVLHSLITYCYQQQVQKLCLDDGCISERSYHWQSAWFVHNHHVSEWVSEWVRVFNRRIRTK